jgi:hypothetical protein
MKAKFYRANFAKTSTQIVPLRGSCDTIKAKFKGFFSQKLLAHLFKSCKVGFQQLYLLGWVGWSGWCRATPNQSGRKVSFVQLYASA